MKIKIIIFVSFFTMIIFSQNLKFAVMSDSRGNFNGVNEPILKMLVNDLLNRHDDVKFLIFPGDMVSGDAKNSQITVAQLNHWKNIMMPVYNNEKMIGQKIYTTVGNHEIRTRFDEGNFRKLFPENPVNGPADDKGFTYSFEVEDNHFVIINTNRWYYGNPQDTTDDKPDWHTFRNLEWLEQDLKAAVEKGVKNIFVAGHEMPFPTGGHLKDGLPNLTKNLVLPLDSTRLWYLNQRNKFWDILNKYNVKAYFCGHEHLYSRQKVNNVYQILVGSCGAPVYYHNPKFGDNPVEKRKGQEYTYNEALPYYKLLNYNYGENGNAQAGEEFFGARAFHYSVMEITDSKTEVKTYGIKVKENSYDETEGVIELIDTFIIK